MEATPSPHHYHNGDDPTIKTLFDLGVVDDLQIRLFVQGVQDGLAPWRQIDPVNLQSSRDTTLQDAADSVQTGAELSRTEQ